LQLMNENITRDSVVNQMVVLQILVDWLAYT